MRSVDNYADYVVRRISYVLTVERKYMQTNQMTAVIAIWGHELSLAQAGFFETKHSSQIRKNVVM